MKRSSKRVLACCLIMAMCLCNLSGTAITSQAAGKKATAITLNAKSKSLTVGQEYQLKVTKIKPSKASKSVTWKSSNSKVAKVNSKGKVTAKKAGKATITAISKTNKKVKATCKITVYSKPTKVSLNCSRKEIKVGESFQLDATIAPKKAQQTVTYSSSDSQIATVTKNGKVTGKKEGKTTITVVSKVNKSKKAKCVVQVSAVAKITQVPDITKAPSAVPTVTEVPRITEVPEATIAPTATDIPTITNIPTITEAPEENGGDTSSEESYADLSGPRTDAEGNVTYDCVYFGNYPQSDATGETKEPIKWRILSINGTEAFLVADQNLDVYRYNEECAVVTWESSTIRSWLNGYGSEANACGKDYSSDNFINRAFTNAEQEAIPYVTVINEDNPNYGTKGGNDTQDKIYLLSIAEVSDAAYGFLPYRDEDNNSISDNARRRTNTYYVAVGGTLGDYYANLDGNDWWWLRSPGFDSINASYVNKNGNVNEYGSLVIPCGDAVCPALHLNLSSTNVWSNAGTVTIEREVATVTSVPTVTEVPEATSAPTATSIPTVTNIPTVTSIPTVTNIPTITGIPTITVTDTPTPTITTVPVITVAPGEDGGSTNSGGNYADLSGPRTDAEGNVTYDCVYFGSYPQSDATGQTKEPIKWRILSINGTEAFLVADQNLDVYRYNEEQTEVTWETSTIRSWLNGYGSEANVCGKDYSGDNFINRAFTNAEQEAIPYVTVINEDNPEFGTEGGNDTLDKIYLLSVSEVSNAAYGFLTYRDEDYYCIYDNARKRTNTAYVAAGGTIGSSAMSSEGNNEWWWLRSTGEHCRNASDVSNGGIVNWIGSDVLFSYTAVCPALHLNLSSTNVWSNAGTVTIER